LLFIAVTTPVVTLLIYQDTVLAYPDLRYAQWIMAFCIQKDNTWVNIRESSKDYVQRSA
jgi:hypothetical protein